MHCQKNYRGQIHRIIWVLRLKLVGYVAFLITSKVLDVRRRGAIEGNAADEALMVDQAGDLFRCANDWEEV
jgi:hypothetical protein